MTTASAPVPAWQFELAVEDEAAGVATPEQLTWLEADRPVLVITAKSKLREIFFDRINAGLAMTLEKPSYVHVRLSGTNHIFTTGGAIATVTKHLQTNWQLFAR